MNYRPIESAFFTESDLARFWAKVAIYMDRRFQRIIAADYGISQGHVADIKSGKHWGHLTGAVF